MNYNTSDLLENWFASVMN